jgi:hypothetical protein
MLKRGTTKCPVDKVGLHWHQMQGMRLTREIVPQKPKRPYFVYDAKCPKCGQRYEVKK